MWPYKTGDILKEVQFIYDKTIKCGLTRLLSRGDHIDRCEAEVGF